MISFALKRKKKIFKENNLTLHRFILAIILVLGPIILMFSPLPGYLLNESSHWLARFSAFTFFVFLGAFETFIYWRFWSRKEILYLNYIYGKYRMLYRHTILFVGSCILYFVFTFAAFAKMSISLNSIFYIFGCYSLLFLIFIMWYAIKLKPMTLQINLLLQSYPIKLIGLTFTNGVKTRVSLVLSLLILSVGLQFQSIELDVLHNYLIGFFLLISCIFNSIYKLININILKNKNFLKSINPHLYLQYRNTMRLLVCGLFLLSTLLNFKILII